MKPYTHKEIDRITRLRIAGWPPADIAGMTNRSVSSISRLLSVEKRKHGHQYPKVARNDSKWTAWRIEQLAREHPAKPYAVIAKEHGISKPRLSYLMAKRARGLQEGAWMA